MLPVCASCATCRFFLRFTADSTSHFEERDPMLFDDSEALIAPPVVSTAVDTDLLEYGKCVRNPPQFYSETLNGEWPVIHRSRVCGEYRTNGERN